MHGVSVEQAHAAATGPAAFVFDIDGVLRKGRTTIPEAPEAIKRLYQRDGKAPRVPVAFLTNGGGMTERQKASELSDWLDVPVTPNQVVLSHTPFRQLTEYYAKEPVLVLGRGDVAGVARSYGLRNAVTSHKLACAAPTAVPFWPESGTLYTQCQRLYSTPALRMQKVSFKLIFDEL